MKGRNWQSSDYTDMEMGGHQKLRKILGELGSEVCELSWQCFVCGSDIFSLCFFSWYLVTDASVIATSLFKFPTERLIGQANLILVTEEQGHCCECVRPVWYRNLALSGPRAWFMLCCSKWLKLYILSHLMTFSPCFLNKWTHIFILNENCVTLCPQSYHRVFITL